MRTSGKEERGRLTTSVTHDLPSHHLQKDGNELPLLLEEGVQGSEGKGRTRRSGTVLTLRLAQGIQQLLILLLRVLGCLKTPLKFVVCCSSLFAMRLRYAISLQVRNMLGWDIGYVYTALVGYFSSLIFF